MSVRGWTYKIWRVGDGGLPLYVWMFYDLLKNFLDSGSMEYRGSNRDAARKPIIRTLEIDFVEPKDTSLLAQIPDDLKTLHRAQTMLHYPLRHADVDDVDDGDYNES